LHNFSDATSYCLVSGSRRKERKLRSETDIDEIDADFGTAIQKLLFDEKVPINSSIEQDEQVALALQTKLLKQESPIKSMFGDKSCADTKSSTMQAPTQIFGTIILDAAICPKTFGGTTAKSAEDWLKLFERLQKPK
jgi:hypothetical protein